MDSSQKGWILYNRKNFTYGTYRKKWFGKYVFEGALHRVFISPALRYRIEKIGIAKKNGYDFVEATITTHHFDFNKSSILDRFTNLALYDWCASNFKIDTDIDDIPAIKKIFPIAMMVEFNLYESDLEMLIYNKNAKVVKYNLSRFDKNHAGDRKTMNRLNRIFSDIKSYQNKKKNG